MGKSDPYPDDTLSEGELGGNRISESYRKRSISRSLVNNDSKKSKRKSKMEGRTCCW